MKIRKCFKIIFFDLGGYFELSVFKISRVDFECNVKFSGLALSCYTAQIGDTSSSTEFLFKEFHF